MAVNRRRLDRFSTLLLASIGLIAFRSALAAWPTAPINPREDWTLPPARPVPAPRGNGTLLMQEAGLISTLPLDVGVTDVAFSPDNKWVAAACGDGTAHILDIATGKELAVCKGHKRAIYRIMFTPDGKQLVTGSQDGTARLWDATTGKLVRTFVGHENHVHGIAMDAASNTLLTASCDGSFILWDMATGKSKVVKQTGGQNESCAFAPDGKSFFIGTLVVGGADGQIQSLTAAVHRYDAATQQETQTYQMDGNNVADIQISADMSTMVACSWDQCFFLNLASGKLIKSERIGLLHREDVKSTLSKDLSHIYVNGNFLVPFQKTGVPVGSKNIPPVTHGVALSPDDSMIAVPFGGEWGNDDNQTFTSQPVNGVLLFDRKQFDDAVTASPSVQNSRQIAALSNDLAVLGSFDGKMNIWDFNKGKSILEFDGPREPMMLAASWDRRFVAAPEPHKHIITLMSLETGKQLQQLSGHKAPVTGLAFGDNVLYSASEDGHVIAWNVATGEKKFDTDLGQPAHGLTFTGTELLTAVEGQLVHITPADGKDTREPLTAKTVNGEIPLARVRNSQPGTLVLLQFNKAGAAPVLAFYDLSRRALQPGFERLPEEPVTGTADGRVIGRVKDTSAVVPSPDGIYNFVLRYGSVAKERAAGSLNHQHLSPDRKYDLVWSEVASLVNSVNGLVVQRFIPPADEAPPTGKLFAAAFSPDQTKVATAGRDKMIRIWNSATGEMLKKYDSPAPFVQNVVFTPDGKSLVVAAGVENPPAPNAQLPKGPFQISFVDIETGKVTQSTLAEVYGSSLAFSSSGKYLLIDPAPFARGSGKIRVWDVAAKKDAAVYVGSYWSTEPAQFINDNLLIAAQGDACRLMKPGTGTPIWSIPQAKMSSTSAQVSPDGLWGLIQCNDKTTRLLDLKTGKQIEQWSGITASTFTPKGQPFIIKDSQTAIVYDPASLKSQVAQFRALESLKPFVAPDGSLALIGPGVMIPVPLSAGEKP